MDMLIKNPIQGEFTLSLRLVFTKYAIYFQLETEKSVYKSDFRDRLLSLVLSITLARITRDALPNGGLIKHAGHDK